MTDEKTIEELMNKYISDLMKIYEKRAPDLEEAEEVIFPTEEETEEVAESLKEPEPDPKVEPEEEKTTLAPFYALVTTGMGAYPVEDAKVIIKNKDELVAFLVTDESGRTPKIELSAYSKESSLSPETAKTAEYTAEIIAEGFTSQKGLEVASQGTEVSVLNVNLIPNEERME